MDKKTFRNFCRNRLIKTPNPYYRSKIINKRLWSLLKKYQKILGFYPLKGEVDIRPVLKKLQRSGKKVYLPKVEENNLHIVKYGPPFKRGKFAVEPLNRKSVPGEKIDIALIPVIGVDLTLRRIGFGKGFYDRFFGGLNYRPNLLFLQLIPCISPETLTDWWDVEGDRYISFNFEIERRRPDDRVYSIGGGYRSWRIFNRPMAGLRQIRPLRNRSQSQSPGNRARSGNETPRGGRENKRAGIETPKGV
ncbi:MAG: 5-formyltetrahydrofolate cyclo-ligase [Epsilonproteobacteria bacterium]|jgi:5-formyltetrahydrofolate cyclo-ligase|nr:5-formyltetrahydrofolate cyclo-ligase [Campylobacterota bacterium]NPA88586.1 5-formyltetrahydrofolate cyclo-ligase [Campylobacterota bacterium]